MDILNTINSLQDGVDTAVNNVWALVAALAGVGIFAMALIEIFRLIFQPRLFLNRAIVRRWLTTSGQVDAEAQIVKLSTGGNAYLLYSLPVERMAGQINAAAQIALAYPATYPTVITALAANSEPTDVDVVTGGQATAPSPQDYAEARNRVANMIQRNLDALQIRINGYWSRGLQVASVVVSVLLILVFLSPSAVTVEDYLRVIIFAVIGGMVAPVAKDILSTLKKVKERAR